MRDPGLQEAIRAVGGVSELARRVGISQPSVSNWERIPAERVLSVEAATGVARAVLRPDLFNGEASERSVDEVDASRAQEYALLSTLLSRSPDAQLLARLGRLRGDASLGKPRPVLMSKRWGRSISIYSSGWDVASCCLTRPTT